MLENEGDKEFDLKQPPNWLIHQILTATILNPAKTTHRSLKDTCAGIGYLAHCIGNPRQGAFPNKKVDRLIEGRLQDSIVPHIIPKGKS